MHSADKLAEMCHTSEVNYVRMVLHCAPPPGMCRSKKECAMQEAINPVADIKTESNQRHNEGQELVAGSL